MKRGSAWSIEGGQENIIKVHGFGHITKKTINKTKRTAND